MINFSNIALNSKDPVYIQISKYVKQQILLKNVLSEEFLPSRREIAVQLNINLNTVQKAFKLMEYEGYVITMGNKGSMIYINDEIFSGIENELTHVMVKAFIKSAKEINLSFKGVIDLISEVWDE